VRTRALLPLVVLLLALVIPAFAGAAPIPVGGQVYGPGGSPLEGARVLLLPVAGIAEASRLELEGKAGPDPVATVSTKADGAFRLQAPEAGMWKVEVRAPGLLPQEILLTPLVEETELPSLKLERDAGLEVRVTGADGKPLAGARVRISDTSQPRRMGIRLGSAWSAPSRIALTDGKGLAVLPRGSGERLLVQAGAEGRPAAEQRDVRSGSASLRLPAGTTREIRVLDASGKKPEPGVWVRVGEDPWIAGRTSEDGRFAVPLANDPKTQKARKTKIILEAGDGRRLEAYAEPAKQGETGPRTLRLPVLETLTGRVVSAADGRPVAGALVWGHDPGAVRKSGADGVYRIDVVAGREAWTQAAAPGFLGADAQTGVQPGLRRGPTLALEPALAVAGMVVDEQGRPVPGVQIKASPQPAARMRSAAMFRSGGLFRSSAAGRFRVSGLLAGLGHELRLTRTGFAPATAEVAPLEPGRPVSELRVVLRKGRTGFGRIVNQSEQPVAGAQVVIRPAPSGDMRMRMMRFQAGEAATYEAAADASGRFEVRDLPPGTYELTARGAGYAPITVPGLALPPGAGSTDLGTVVLVPGVPVEGYVVDPGGNPVPGAEVYATETAADPMSRILQSQEEPRTVLTGQDGFFRIEDRRAGESVTLGASRTGYAPAAATGVQVPPEQPVRLVLQPSAAVEGRAVDPDGKPVAGVRIVVHPADPMAMGGGTRLFTTARIRQTVSDETGFFRAEDVIPGTIELQAMATGFQDTEIKNLEVRAGQELKGVEVVLAPGAVIEGRVLSPSGQPVIGAEVSVAESNQSFSLRRATSDGDGHYRMEGVAPGTRTIQAEHKGYRRSVRELEVRAGENSLDLRLEGGVEVSGRVLEEGGTPLASARVQLREGWSSWNQPSATSGADGSFTLTGVADGTYRLLAEKEGYARSREGQELTVAGSSVGGIEIKLTSGGAIVGQLSGLDFTELSQVRVWLVNAGRQSGQVAPDGTYRIDHVEPGDYRVLASLPGGSRQAEGQVTLEPGAPEARLDLELGGGYTLSGRVVRNGEPARALSVALSGGGISGRFGETDHQGRFRFEGLDAGRYELEVFGFRAQTRHREEVEVADDRDVLIELRTVAISGRVVDAADQSPIAGAEVTLLAPQEDGSSLPVETTTDSRGVFSLRDVSEGSWKLRAVLPGYAPEEVAVQVDAAPVDGVELSLQATEGVVLEVLLQSGRPPDEVSTAVLDASGQVISAASYPTGEDGRVRVASVAPGNWELVLSAAGSAPVTVSVTAPGHAGRVILPQPGGLNLKVPGLSEARIAAKVTLTDASGRPYRAHYGSYAPKEFDLYGGTRNFDRLAPGTWKLTVAAADGRSWTGSATVTPGRTEEVTLE